MLVKTINGRIFNFMAIISAMFILFSACDNKEPLPEEGEKPGDENTEVVEPEVDTVADSLSNAIVKQAHVMSSLLMESSIEVSSCRLQENGTYQISLSNGLGCVSLSEAESYSSMLSYATVESDLCWALCDKSGKSQVMKKPSGNAILLSENLDVQIKDDKYYLVVNQQEYATEFVKADAVQAFSCGFFTDAAGDVYAVTFAFDKETPVTYYVTSYAGATLHLPGAEPTAGLYVNKATTVSIVLDIPKGVDYKFTITEGWACQKREEGDVVYLDVTAPQDEPVEAELVVLTAVGDKEMTKLALTTEPFKSVFASATDVVVIPNSGVEKFVYGVCDVFAFDAEEVVAKAAEILAGGAAQQGYVLADASVSTSIAEVLGKEMDPEERYILWAIPALRAENGYATDAATLRSCEFGSISFNFEVAETKLMDAEISVAVKGADAVFGGAILKSDDAFTEILYQINNSILDSIPAANQDFLFEGFLSDYPAVDSYKNEIEPESTYIVWAAAAVPGEYEYTEKDINFIEVTTNGLVPGGEIQTTLGQPETTPSTFKAQVTAEGATMVYYAFLNNSTGNRYSGDDVPNEDKFKYLMANSPVATKGSSVLAHGKKLNPSTTYWLYAVAVDADGKYGPVKCVSAKTPALSYDTSISLSVTAVDCTSKKLSFKVTSNGGDLSDYIYWAGRSQDPFWKNSTFCGGSKTTAEKYMALNPDDENITKAMAKYGSLSEDGMITLNGLTMETEYVFIILEKGETNYSKAAQIKISTLAADLGTVVKEGDAKWAEAKAAVKIDWIERFFVPAANSNMMATYGFNISCPKDLTAYVMCASDTYFAEAGFTKVEHIMIEIENYASRRYTSGHTPIVNGELALEPDYYKDGELRNGQLMNVYDYYVHGVPNLGFVTYFAEGSHGPGNCIYWENGACTEYQNALDGIAYHNSMAAWEYKASLWGLTGKEAADWAAALHEAYSVYYKDAVPIIYENTGGPLTVTTPYATGKNDEGVIPDRVIVMLKDLNGNYYEPMSFEVPDLFE